MTFKVYNGTQPDESKELMPDILSALKQKGYQCFDESLFDIYVISKNNSGKHIEIKVRLKSQRGNLPISSKQWDIIHDILPTSPINLNTKVVIYDSGQQKYSLTDLHEISKHIQKNRPKSTCYNRKTLWSNIVWLSPIEAYIEVKKWIDTM